jgi:hypothetical protein
MRSERKGQKHWREHWSEIRPSSICMSTATEVQMLLHARNMGDSDSILEARAEFSAMEKALRRNRNANLHKLAFECVLKPFKTTLHSCCSVSLFLSLLEHLYGAFY